MSQENILLIFITLTLAVLGYYVFNNMLTQKVANTQNTSQKNGALPMYIQAHERLTLFLERIKPEALFARINSADLNAKELQQTAISEIRAELNHNVTQQLYIRPETWLLIQTAVQTLIAELIAVNNSLDAKAFKIEFLTKPNQDSLHLIDQALLSLKTDFKNIIEK
jgi:hypothetical protein